MVGLLVLCCILLTRGDDEGDRATMGTVIGIDLGTTYSCIAYQERQSKERQTKIVVADKHRAEYCIPTAVYFPPNHKSSKVIIGEDALKKLATDPLNVIYDVKRIVGRKCNDPEIKSFQSKHEFNVTCHNRDDNP